MRVNYRKYFKRYNCSFKLVKFKSLTKIEKYEDLI